jgi:hypothetical protein
MYAVAAVSCVCVLVLCVSYMYYSCIVVLYIQLCMTKNRMDVLNLVHTHES